MNIFEELRQDVQGVALLVDWIGSGGEPVSQIHAEHRADACVHGNDGKPCPLNCEPGWWDRAKGAIAETIRGQLELKKKLNLHLSCDASLHMCKAVREQYTPFNATEAVGADSPHQGSHITRND